MDCNTPAARIKALRTHYSLTQAEFAQSIHKSKGKISRLENSHSPLSEDIIVAVCSVYPVSVEWLTGGNGSIGDSALIDSAQFAERVRAVRLKFGLSQGQFAAALSCSAAHISGVETKRHRPSLDFLKRVSETFHVRYEWLIYGTGEMGGAWTDNRSALFIGDRIKMIRSRWLLSQHAFAKQIGTTRLMVKYLENGQKCITEDLMDIICRTFAVSPVWLKTGEGSMTNGAFFDFRF